MYRQTEEHHHHMVRRASWYRNAIIRIVITDKAQLFIHLMNIRTIVQQDSIMKPLKNPKEIVYCRVLLL